jgi:hypothetical protein
MFTIERTLTRRCDLGQKDKRADREGGRGRQGMVLSPRRQGHKGFWNGRYVLVSFGYDARTMACVYLSESSQQFVNNAS